MVVNQKVTGTASSMPVGLLWGAAGSMIVTAAGAALFAYLILHEMLAESSIGYAAMVVILISALLGALLSVSKIKRRRSLVCALSGLIYFGILLSMTALLFGGQYQGMGVTALLVLAGSGTALLLGLRQKNPGKASKRKIRHREVVQNRQVGK